MVYKCVGETDAATLYELLSREQSHSEYLSWTNPSYRRKPTCNRPSFHLCGLRIRPNIFRGLRFGALPPPSTALGRISIANQSTLSQRSPTVLPLLSHHTLVRVRCLAIGDLIPP